MKKLIHLTLCAVATSCLLASRAVADNTYSNAVMSLAPVAYWPLNETTQPPAAGNLATNLGTAGAAYNGYYGSSVASGQSGALVADPDTSITLNGTSSAILDIPYGPAASNSAPFTVEAWLNAQGNTGSACALSSGLFAANRSGWLIYANVSAGQWSFRTYKNNGTATSLSISGGTVDSNWHHVVAVWDGTNGYLYDNGALVAGPTAATGYVPNIGGDITIGERSDSSFYWIGGIDEVAIYSNILSASDVLAHYQNGTNSTPSQSYSSLVLAKKPPFYYRLGETISSPTSTVTANNYGSLGATVNGTYLPGTQPAISGPKGNGFGPVSLGCKFVPASGGYVDCTADPGLDITTQISVVGWFQGAPADNRFQSFLGRSDNSWRADVDGNGVAHFADGSANPDAVGQTPINGGDWHFFAGVYDGSYIYIYIDGVLDGTNTAASGVSGDSVTHMVIGGVGDYIPGRLFKGNVAQVAVFSSVLTGAQVQTLYYAGELLPAITKNPSNTIVGLGAASSLATTASGNPTLVYQWYKGTTKLSDVAGNISGSTTPTLNISNAQSANSGNYSVVVTNNYGSVTSLVAVLTVTPSPAVVTQPATNTLIYAGNQLTLNVSAIGAAPLAYQWYSGSTPIAGATTTNLTFAAVAGTNFYRVVITNSYGSATSGVATVAAQKFVAPASGFVVNFDAAGTANQNFTGQGVYSNPGNNAWNAVGNPGVGTGYAYNSASNLTLVTSTAIYGFNNSGIAYNGAVQANGDPSWLLSVEDAVNTGSPGIGNATVPMGQFTVNDLPQGTYTVYLYGENYDGDRGSIFSLAPSNGGFADQGINATANAQPGLNTSDSTVYAEGDNYVFFTNVVADVTGTITVYFVPNDANASILHGEAPFSGAQFVLLVRPTLTIQVSGGNATVSWSPTGGVLQSATNVAGPYSSITGATSPYTTAVTGARQFFRVKM